MLEYIKRRQKQWQKKWNQEAELEAEREAIREAERQLEAEREAEREALRAAEARKREEIAERKKLLQEQQEAERLRQKHIQRKEKLAEQKSAKHLDNLLTQVKARSQANEKLEEVRIIIQNREPYLGVLDWRRWLSDPLNQRLADLDFEYAVQMFKRDNRMARLRPHGTRAKKAAYNYFLSYTGDTDASAAGEYVTTNFNPDDYDLNLGFTVSYWVRPDEVGTHMFAFGRKYSNSERFTFGINTTSQIYIGTGANKLTGRWDSGLADNPSGQTAAELFPSLFDGGALKTGNWLHFAVTYADRESTSEGNVARKVYLNGELIRSQDLNWSSTGGVMDGGLYFGGRALRGSGTSTRYNNGWACGLDEVAIYSEEKDSDFIESVYNGGTKYNHRKSGGSGLVGYWRFNEGSGDMAKDLSGNGNHGTLTNEPAWKPRGQLGSLENIEINN